MGLHGLLQEQIFLSLKRAVSKSFVYRIMGCGTVWIDSVYLTLYEARCFQDEDIMFSVFIMFMLTCSDLKNYHHATE
jgi:hypothetical protein